MDEPKRSDDQMANMALNNPTYEPEDPIEKVIVMVRNCKRVNVRKLPDKSSEVLIVANEGDEFLMNSRFVNDEWICVYDESGLYGYVMKNFVQEVL